MNQRPYHIAIISAARPGLNDVEANARMQRVVTALERAGGYEMQATFGCFRSLCEPSMLISFPRADMLRLILALAATLEQDCVMHVDPSDMAEYICHNNVHRPLGTWCEATAEEAKDRDHTYLPMSGRYFVVN